MSVEVKTFYRLLKKIVFLIFVAAAGATIFFGVSVIFGKGIATGKQAVITIMGILLMGTIITLLYLTCRAVSSAINRKLEGASADKKTIIYKTPIKAGIVERVAVMIFRLLSAALIISGFWQYATLSRDWAHIHTIQLHTKIGVPAFFMFVLCTGLMARRYFSWKVTVLVVLYPFLFIWLLLAPVPMLLSLIFFNALLLPGAILFLALRETPPPRRPEIIVAGLLLYGFIFAMMTGLFSTLNPVTLRYSFYHRIFHGYLAPCALLPPLYYVIRYRTNLLRGGGGKKIVFAVAALAVGVAAGGVLHAMKHHRFDRIHKRNFYPSQMLATDKNLKFRNIPTGLLSANKECEACHDVPYRQWARSTHAYAARTVTFQKIARTLMEQHGAETGRHCATCHDPEVAFSHDPWLLVDPEHVKKSEGVSCRVCHYMSVEQGKNALYGLSLPRSDLLTANPAKRTQYILNAVLEHVRDATKPIGKRGASCFPCHSLESLRKGHIKIPLNNVSSFFESKFSSQMSCHRCHMPRIEKDRGSYSWMDHHFFGIQQELPLVALQPSERELHELQRFTSDTRKWMNGALPVLNNYEAVLDETFKSYRIFNYARRARAIAETANVASGGNHFILALEKSELKRGVLKLSFSSINRNVSHDFPSSLFANIVDVWFELRLTDADGREVFFSGLDPDDLTHRLGRIEVDAAGRAITPADSLKYQEIINKKYLRPEKKYIDSYAIPVGKGARFPLQARYRLMYHRYNDEFIQWASDGKIKSVPKRIIAEKRFRIKR